MSAVADDLQYLKERIVERPEDCRQHGRNHGEDVVIQNEEPQQSPQKNRNEEEARAQAWLMTQISYCLVQRL